MRPDHPQLVGPGRSRRRAAKAVPRPRNPGNSRSIDVPGNRTPISRGWDTCWAASRSSCFGDCALTAGGATRRVRVTDMAMELWARLRAFAASARRRSFSAAAAGAPHQPTRGVQAHRRRGARGRGEPGRAAPVGRRADSRRGHHPDLSGGLWPRVLVPRTQGFHSGMLGCTEQRRAVAKVPSIPRTHKGPASSPACAARTLPVRVGQGVTSPAARPGAGARALPRPPPRDALARP